MSNYIYQGDETCQTIFIKRCEACRTRFIRGAGRGGVCEACQTRFIKGVKRVKLDSSGGGR